jgi:hypothetical protein
VKNLELLIKETTVKKIFINAMVIVGLLACTGCGDSDSSVKSCNDACAASYGCASKLNMSASSLNFPATESECVTQCNAGSCANKQQVIDCISSLECGSDSTTYAMNVFSCYRSNNCAQ